MRELRHILVADCANESPSNIAFLLKLAGFRVSIFNDELEACNWLLQQDPKDNPADMLLLNEPHPDRSLFALLFQMRQRFANLELLLVAGHPLELTGQITDLSPPVHQCMPNEVHSVTRQVFNRVEIPANPQPHQPSADTGKSRKNYDLYKVGQEKP